MSLDISLLGIQASQPWNSLLCTLQTYLFPIHHCANKLDNNISYVYVRRSSQKQPI